MLVNRQKIVEKIVRNDAGEAFRLFVLVYEEAGEIKGRILSATPLEASKRPAWSADQAMGQLALSGAIKRRAVSEVVKEYSSELVPSPFKSLLYWNLNIARGPNL